MSTGEKNKLRITVETIGEAAGYETGRKTKECEGAIWITFDDDEAALGAYGIVSISGAIRNLFSIIPAEERSGALMECFLAAAKEDEAEGLREAKQPVKEDK